MNPKGDLMNRAQDGPQSLLQKMSSGLLGGWVVLALAGQLLVFLPWILFNTGASYVFVVIVVWEALVYLLMAFGQQWIIRRVLPESGRWLWFGVTLASFFAASLTNTLFANLNAGWSAQLTEGAWLGVQMLQDVVLGFLSGLGPWLLLKKFFRHAWWWLVAACGFFVVSRVVMIFWPFGSNLLPNLALSGVNGLMSGIFSGVCLWGLLQKDERQPAQPALPELADPARAPVQNFRSARGLGSAAQVLFGLLFIFEWAVTVNPHDFLNPVFSIATLLVGLAGFGLFCLWIYRAYQNLSALGAEALKYSPAWAVGGFFVPLLNVVRPYQVMAEIWQGSSPRCAPGTAWKRQPVSALVGWWWGLTLVSLISTRVYGLLGSAGFAVSFVFGVLALCQLGLFVALVAWINWRQEAKYALLKGG